MPFGFSIKVGFCILRYSYQGHCTWHW